MSTHLNIPVTLNIPLAQITMLARFAETREASNSHDIDTLHICELAENGLLTRLENGSFATTQLGEAALEAVMSKHPTEMEFV